MVQIVGNDTNHNSPDVIPANSGSLPYEGDALEIDNNFESGIGLAQVHNGPGEP